MLTSSFIHIPGIGAKTEERIWAAGAETLEMFLRSPSSFLTQPRAERISRGVEKSLQCLAEGDCCYFYSGLNSCDYWRMFREFRNKTAYLDIETTGLGAPGDTITTIALYDGLEVYTYVKGDNLEDFPGDIQRYSLLVTYNGKTFDVPFIEKYFGITLQGIPHIDLRYILGSLGYRGGLKSCERQLGLSRSSALSHVDGYFAVLLWDEYTRSGDRDALETLLAYNVEDTVNLELLMVEAYNRKLTKLPLSVSPLNIPEKIATQWRISTGVVDRVIRNNSGGYDFWN